MASLLTPYGLKMIQKSSKKEVLIEIERIPKRSLEIRHQSDPLACGKILWE